MLSHSLYLDGVGASADYAVAAVDALHEAGHALHPLLLQARGSRSEATPRAATGSATAAVARDSRKIMGLSCMTGVD
jgi:ribosomal protein S12 methylthiotransferase accessory factor YcaO